MFRSRIDLTKFIFSIILALCMMAGGIVFLTSECYDFNAGSNQETEVVQAANVSNYAYMCANGGEMYVDMTGCAASYGDTFSCKNQTFTGSCCEGSYEAQTGIYTLTVTEEAEDPYVSTDIRVFLYEGVTYVVHVEILSSYDGNGQDTLGVYNDYIHTQRGLLVDYFGDGTGTWGELEFGTYNREHNLTVSQTAIYEIQFINHFNIDADAKDGYVLKQSGSYITFRFWITIDEQVEYNDNNSPTFSVSNKINGSVTYKGGYYVLYNTNRWVPEPTRDGYVFMGWKQSLCNQFDYTVAAGGGVQYKYWEVAELKEKGKYDVSVRKATKEYGTASYCSVLVYDFTQNTSLDSYNLYFGENIRFSIAVPESADLTHDIKLLFYAGKAGETAGVTVVFDDVYVARSAYDVNSSGVIIHPGTDYVWGDTNVVDVIVPYIATWMPRDIYYEWKKNKFIVDPAGGTYNGSTSPTIIARKNNSSYTLQIPTRKGYKFKGWSIGNDLIEGTTAFDGQSTFKALGRKYMYTDEICISIRASMDDWSEYSTSKMRLISCTQGGGWNLQPSSDDNKYVTFACYDSGIGWKHAMSTIKWSDLSSGYHTFQCTFNGEYTRLYIDGAWAATSVPYTSGEIGYHETNGIFVGAEAGKSASIPVGQYFKGTIDYVTITNSATLTMPTTYELPYGSTAATAQWEWGAYEISLDSKFYASSSATSGTTVDSTGTKVFYEEYDTGLYTSSACLTAISIIDIPKYTGYTFGGYYTGKAGTGAQYIDSFGGITADATSFVYDTTLYAYWIPKTPKVTYDANGGSLSSSYETDYVTYNGTYAGKSNIYRDQFSSLRLTNSGCQFTLSADNSSGSSTIFKNFFSTYDGCTFKANTTYTVVVYVTEFSGNSFSLTATSPYDTETSGTGDVATASTSFSITGIGTYVSTFITKADLTGSVYNMRSYIPIPAGSSSTATFYFAVFPGHFIGDPTNTSYETSTVATGTSLPTPTRTGYTFAGWWTEATGGTQVTASTTVTTASDHTLYAHWTVNNYTLKVDPNGGYRTSDNSTSVITYSKDYGETVSITERKRTGYTLTGYTLTNSATGSTTDLGGATFTFDSSTKTGTYVQGTIPCTLTAQWVANQYWVGYYLPPIGQDKGLATFDSDMPAITKPSKSGYTFDGYYGVGTRLAVAGWGQLTSNGQNAFRVNFTVGSLAVGDTVVCSVVSTQQLTSIDYNDTVLASTYWNQVELDGMYYIYCCYTIATDRYPGQYCFLDFNASSDNVSTTGKYIELSNIVTGTSEKQYYTATGASARTYDTDANMLLVAKWTANNYNITWDGSSASLNANLWNYAGSTGYTSTNTGSNSSYTYNGKSATSAVVYDAGIAYYTPIPQRLGHKFTGWWTATTGGAKVASSDGQLVAGVSGYTDASKNWIYAGNATLYAQWTANSYSVSYNLNGGTASSTSPNAYSFGTTKTVGNPSRIGYTFLGWTVTSTLTGKTYGTINLGTGVLQYDSQYSNAVYFPLFYQQANVQYSGKLSDVNNDIRWRQYTLAGAFSSNGVSATSSNFYTSLWYHGGMNSANTTISWSQAAGYTIPATQVGDLTLVARWSINSYTITAYSNSGTISSTDGWSGTGTSATKQVSYGSTYGELPEVTKTGYSLKGWYTAKTGGSQVTSETIMGAAGVTIYAQWTINSYNLIANCNGGSAPEKFPSGWTANGTKPYKLLEYNSNYGDLIEPTREGHIFVGWFTAASGGSEVSSSTKMTSTSGATIYAHWVESWVKYRATSLVQDQSDGYYIISSAGDLAQLAYLVNYNDASGNWATAKYKQTADIDLSGHYWQPIGTESHPFKGTFDGNGYVIKNMHTYSGENYYSTYDNQGLFGYVSGATISNLNNHDIVVDGKDGGGGIAGYVGENSTVSNCKVSGKSCGANSIGGIVGRLMNSSTVTGCENYSTVGTTDGVTRVGGIVGYAKDSSIERCVNYGLVKCAVTGAGIVAQANGVKVSSCVNNGEVAGAHIAGIITYAAGEITILSCINNGHVYGESSVCGIVNTIYSEKDVLIQYCLNTGKLELHGDGSENGSLASLAVCIDGSNVTISSCFVECELAHNGATGVGSMVGYIASGTTKITYCGLNIKAHMHPFYDCATGANLIINDSYCINEDEVEYLISAEHSDMDGYFSMINQIHGGLPVPIGIYHLSKYGTKTGIADYLINTLGCSEFKTPH